MNLDAKALQLGRNKLCGQFLLIGDLGKLVQMLTPGCQLRLLCLDLGYQCHGLYSADADVLVRWRIRI